ncbi:MAG TPA: hypothetical protein PLF26_09640 [Blastocatellia bacterium]|nr:hypothetical protein [Blastocatellia bacterium]
MKAQLLFVAFRALRKRREQIETAARQPDRLSVCEPVYGIHGGLFEVPDGLPVVRPSLKVHSELGSYLSSAGPKQQFTFFSNPPVESHALQCGYPLVEHVAIQGVDKAVPTDRFAVREYVNAAVLNELMSPGQFVEPIFHLRSILAEGGDHRERREFRSRYACRLERSLLIRIEMIELLLDHLSDAVGHADLDAFYLDPQCRHVVELANQSFSHEIVDGVDQKQRISLGSLAYEPRKPRRKPIARESHGQVLGDRILAKVIERQLLALLLGQQFLRHGLERISAGVKLRRAKGADQHELRHVTLFCDV